MNNAGRNDATVLSLIHAGRAVEQKIEAALSSVGLSMPKLSVLSALADSKEPMPLRELANALSCVRSNVTQLVDRLEADGLVRRVDDASDRRSVRAELTAQGRERQAVGAEAYDKVRAELATKISSADNAVIERLLSALG